MSQTDTLKDTAIRLLHDVHAWRCVIAVAAIATMMLPWAYLDGARHPLTGAELIAYTFTGSERGAMAGHSVPGALALLVTPMLTLAMSILVFVRIYRGQQPVILNAVTGCLPLLIVVLAGGVTSSAHLTGPGMAAPQVGMVLGFLCQATLAGHTLATRYQQDRRAAQALSVAPSNPDEQAAQPQAAQPQAPTAVDYHRMENPDIPRSLLVQPRAVSSLRVKEETPQDTSPKEDPQDRMPVRVVTQPGEAKWLSDSGPNSGRKHGRTRRPAQRRYRQED